MCFFNVQDKSFKVNLRNNFRNELKKKNHEKLFSVFHVLEADPNDVVARVNRREQKQHEDGQQVPGGVALRPLCIFPVFVTAEVPADRAIQFPCADTNWSRPIWEKRAYIYTHIRCVRNHAHTFDLLEIPNRKIGEQSGDAVAHKYLLTIARQCDSYMCVILTCVCRHSVISEQNSYLWLELVVKLSINNFTLRYCHIIR